MYIAGIHPTEFLREAEAVRAEWKHMGITTDVCHISTEAYEENIARSVLERMRIEVTEENIKHVLAIMSGN